MQKVVDVSARELHRNKWGERDFAEAVNRVLQENRNRKLEAIYPISGDFGTERLLVVLSDRETEMA